MKKIILFGLLFVLSLSSCNNDDTISGTKNPELIGSWKINRDWGSISGTETITFSSNSTYSVELKRTEAYSGPCNLDPYCNNDFSGKYWFEGSKLYYDCPEVGWTDFWSTWSVQGNILHLDDEIYNKL